MSVRICHGATRYVLLVGPLAIKVTRIGITNVICNTYTYIFKRANVADKVSKFTRGDSLLVGIRRYLSSLVLHGRRANIQEQRLSRDYPELPFAKVIGIYCYGTILLMERGSPVPAAQSAHFREQFPNSEFPDMPHHTCLVNGQMRIIDYGNADDLVVLPR